MKGFRFSLLLSACLPALGMAHAAPVTAVIPPRIAKAAAQFADAGAGPALVIAMVDDGRSQIAGYGHLADGRAPDASTVFEIGSVTKTFTALLLAREVQQGTVKLDTPVSALLPDFRIPSRDGKAITLGLLAEQYSGLTRLPDNLQPANPADPYADYGRQRLQAFLAGYALPRDPGAAYEYSNLGFGLLGFALAEHAHISYGELLQREVLAPLGMPSTSAELTPALRTRLAPGHDGAGKPAGHWHLDALAGAGALMSDGTDMLRYLQANMGVAKTPLAEAMKTAQTPRLQAGQLGRIGLAWMTTPTPAGDVIWHNGETGGYASFIGFTADGRHGVAILTNAAVDPQALGFAALSPQLPLPVAHKAVAMSTAQLGAYVGQYALAPGFVLDVFLDGDQLFARATGQGAFPIYASARDAFFAGVGGIAIDFERDAHGKVTGLVLHQNGTDRHADRLTAPTAADGSRAISLAPAVLHDYVGHYALTPGSVFAITEQKGQLLAQLTGQAALPIYPSAKDRFFYTAVDARLDFQRNADGKVTALVLHQNGKTMRALRQP